MLTPDYLLHVSEGAEEIAAQLHTQIVKQIVKRIQQRQAKGYDYLLTAQDKWQFETLMESGYLRDDVAGEIAKATKLNAEEIRDAFEDAGIKSVTYENKAYKEAGLAPGKMSPYMVSLMQDSYESTLGEWKNYTRTTADAVQREFIQTMDDIHQQVMSGLTGYTQAYTDAINRLATDGIRIINYLSGHRDTIETATLRCVRTGVSQATARMTEARMNEYGVDLVIVSSHMGARPDHAVWQGKIYSRSGINKKYPDFVSSTGYGTGAGLCGWNCRHSFMPFFEGQGNPFEQYDTEENRKLYEETQQQRAMERAIRKTKRKQQVLTEAAENAPDDASRQQLEQYRASVTKRLRDQNKAYREFCDDHDLRPLPERLKIAQAERKKNR